MTLARCSNGHIFSGRKHGNTCPYCNVAVETGQPATPAAEPVPQALHDNLGGRTVEPVVGWLACIEGPARGQDYRIKSEKNFIGRSDEMHIRIPGDSSLSWKNHAVISYNPVQRNFFLIPGDGAGLVYHNNNAALAPVALNSYDVIRMGRSTFVFVALCGVHFDWESVPRPEIQLAQ